MSSRLLPLAVSVVITLAWLASAATATAEATGEMPELRPAAPTNLRAAPLSSSRIRLTWQDNSDDETAFALLLWDPESSRLIEIPFAIPADVTTVIVSQLEPATRYTFRVRSRNAFGASAVSNRATAATFADGAACSVGDTELCLLGGRFRVELRFHDPRTDDPVPGQPIPAERLESAIAVPSTDQTGLFWFFAPENIELIVKMVDGRALNGHFWVFYGGVSNLEYRLEVTDTETGEVALYHNPRGELCGLADTLAFRDPTPAPEPAAVGGSPPPDPSRIAVTPVEPPASTAGDPKLEPGSCVPGAHNLCLLARRLRVEVRWKNPHDDAGTEGEGLATFAGDNSGYFWFFGPDNTELVVKALDGTGLNRHLWLFYGALTDLEYWITVTDTLTDERRVYYNPPGQVCGRADTRAFPSDSQIP